MDTSLINDIEDDEVVDHELGINDKDISGEGLSQIITRELFTFNSLFILIYEEDDEYIDNC